MRIGSGRRDQAGSVSLELVMLIPVLVLLALFVVWSGQSGRARLIADLAAEEAATAAALCCEAGPTGEAGREAMVGAILESRPGLDFLCVGGVRLDAPASGGTARLFVREEWLPIEPGSAATELGILEVRFSCETDGAVAPLRGLFPTVAVYGQAAEVMVH